MSKEKTVEELLLMLENNNNYTRQLNVIYRVSQSVFPNENQEYFSSKQKFQQDQNSPNSIYDFPFQLYLHVFNPKTKQDISKRKLNFFEQPLQIIDDYYQMKQFQNCQVAIIIVPDDDNLKFYEDIGPVLVPTKQQITKEGKQQYERSGILFKRSNKTGQYKEKQFILYKDHLIYFKPKNKKKKQNFIPLEMAQIQRISDQKEKNVLEIITNDKTYYLSARSQFDLMGWFWSLNKQAAIITENKIIQDYCQKLFQLERVNNQQLKVDIEFIRSNFQDALKTFGQLRWMLFSYLNKEVHNYDENGILLLLEMVLSHLKAAKKLDALQSSFFDEEAISSAQETALLAQEEAGFIYQILQQAMTNFNKQLSQQKNEEHHKQIEIEMSEEQKTLFLNQQLGGEAENLYQDKNQDFIEQNNYFQNKNTNNDNSIMMLDDNASVQNKGGEIDGKNQNNDRHQLVEDSSLVKIENLDECEHEFKVAFHEDFFEKIIGEDTQLLVELQRNLVEIKKRTSGQNKLELLQQELKEISEFSNNIQNILANLLEAMISYLSESYQSNFFSSRTFKQQITKFQTNKIKQKLFQPSFQPKIFEIQDKLDSNKYPTFLIESQNLEKSLQKSLNNRPQKAKRKTQVVLNKPERNPEDNQNRNNLVQSISIQGNRNIVQDQIFNQNLKKEEVSISDIQNQQRQVKFIEEQKFRE